jgi:hypothetical protein
MDIVERLAQRIKSEGTPATPATSDASKALVAEFPGLPTIYIELISSVGSADVGGLRLYNTLVDPDELYDDETAMRLDGFLIFADDRQGTCYALDRHGSWRVVAINGVSGTAEGVAPDLASFLRARFGGYVSGGGVAVSVDLMNP